MAKPVKYRTRYKCTITKIENWHEPTVNGFDNERQVEEEVFKKVIESEKLPNVEFSENE